MKIIAATAISLALLGTAGEASAIAKPTSPTIRTGYSAAKPPAHAGPGCYLERSQVTLAGRMLGVKSMTTVWCTPDRSIELRFRHAL